MTYTTLVADKSTSGSIKSWGNYSKIDSEQCLLEAQSLIYQTLRVREMEYAAALTLLAGQSQVNLPDRYLDPTSLVFKTNELVEQVTFGTIHRGYIFDDAGAVITGRPRLWAHYGKTLIFDCCADEDIGVLVGFYQSLPLLGAGNETNFLTDRYPHLLRSACQAMAADFMDDDAKYQRYSTRLIGQIELTNAENQLSLRGAVLSPG